VAIQRQSAPLIGSATYAAHATSGKAKDIRGYGWFMAMDVVAA
jgi:hypothetical protein